MEPSKFVRDEDILAFQQGDRQAFQRLVEELSPGLIRTAYFWTRDLGIAEDLAQEAWFKAWQFRAALKKPMHFRRWLYRILYNGYIDWSRRRTHQERPQDPAFIHPSTTMFSDSAAPSPEEQFLADEDIRQLNRLLAHLSPLDQHIIALRYGSDCTISEIAMILKMRQGTVKSRIHRALQKLRQELAREQKVRGNIPIDAEKGDVR